VVAKEVKNSALAGLKHFGTLPTIVFKRFSLCQLGVYVDIVGQPERAVHEPCTAVEKPKPKNIHVKKPYKRTTPHPRPDPFETATPRE
jgi:hypothetical protein